MKLMSDLLNVKVGDWVCSADYGWAQVVVLEKDYLQIARGNNFYRSYNYDGTRDGFDQYPTCFPINQIPWPYLELFGPPPAEFKDGDPCWVRNPGTGWNPRIYQWFDGEVYYTYGGKTWKEAAHWNNGIMPKDDE